MNIGISNWYNSSFDSTKMKFFTLLQFLTRLLTSKQLNLIIHNSLGEMERCEKRAFQLLKMRKNKISWNLKTMCVTDFLLTVTFSSMKVYNCHYVESTLKTNFYINFNKINVNFLIFFLQVTEYLNTKKSFSICMFVVMKSG